MKRQERTLYRWLRLVPVGIFVIIFATCFQPISASRNARRPITFSRSTNTNSGASLSENVLLFTQDNDQKLKMHLITIPDDDTLDSEYSTVTYEVQLDRQISNFTVEDVKFAIDFQHNQVIFLAIRNHLFSCTGGLSKQNAFTRKFDLVDTLSGNVLSLKVGHNELTILRENGIITTQTLSYLNNGLKKPTQKSVEFSSNEMPDSRTTFAYKYLDNLFTANAKNEIHVWYKENDYISLEKFASPVLIAKTEDKIQDIAIFPIEGRIFISTDKSILEIDQQGVEKNVLHKFHEGSTLLKIVKIGMHKKFYSVKAKNQIQRSDNNLQGMKKVRKFNDTVISYTPFQQLIIPKTMTIDHKPMQMVSIGITLKIAIFLGFAMCIIPLVVIVILPASKSSDKGNGRLDQIQNQIKNKVTDIGNRSSAYVGSAVRQMDNTSFNKKYNTNSQMKKFDL